VSAYPGYPGKEAIKWVFVFLFSYQNTDPYNTKTGAQELLGRLTMAKKQTYI